MYQGARVYAGLFDGDEEPRVVLPESRYAYLHVARGSIEVNGQRLEAGGGARLRNEREIHLGSGTGAELLLFDLRPSERPEY